MRELRRVGRYPPLVRYNDGGGVCRVPQTTGPPISSGKHELAMSCDAPPPSTRPAAPSSTNTCQITDLDLLLRSFQIACAVGQG
nr:hypothetical protein CFP56_12002 [Quercus suber]